MTLRHVRLALVAALGLALVLTFVPLIPYSLSVSCAPVSGEGFGPLCLAGSRETGLNSLTQFLFGYGGTYSYQTQSYNYGYGLNLGTYHYFIGTSLYTTAVYFPGGLVLFLAGCFMAGLLSPEIVDGMDALSYVIHSRPRVGPDGNDS